MGVNIHNKMLKYLKKWSVATPVGLAFLFSYALALPAATAEPRPASIRDVAGVMDGLVLIEAGNVIRKSCPEIEANRLREESIVKGDQVSDLRKNQGMVEHEIETVKTQRAEMWREITRLKEINDQKTMEANHQADKQKSLNHELSRVSSRIEDTQKLIDLRSHDLRAKQIALEDTQRELARISDHNSKVSAENAALRRDNERVTQENFDLRRDCEF